MSTLEQVSTPFLASQDPSVEIGTFASPDSASVPGKIVIATFNIRYAVGSHLILGSVLRRLGLRRPRRRRELVSRHIRRTAHFTSAGAGMPAIDILALQEADKCTTRAGGVHVARELARELGVHYTHVSMNLPSGEDQKSNKWYLDFEEHIGTDDEGDTGLAMLSRFPFASTTRLDLPWADCAWRPRLATESGFAIGSQNLIIYNVHIDPHASTDEQLEQHRAILDRADRVRNPTVILGDFNTLTSESRLRMRGLLESHGYSTPFQNGEVTWRSGLIRLQPDWIFERDARVSRCGVGKGLNVSDHWPVWIEITIDDSSTR